MPYFPGGLSPFPSDYIKLSLFISGAWVDITMPELSDDGIHITRGSTSESLKQDAGSVSFSLKDPTGKYNSRHPNSPYYGKNLRGTPVRLQVKNTVAGVTSWWNRFYGEIVSLQPAWSITGSPSARVDVEAAGVLRRLGQGHSMALSTLRRVLEGQSGVVAYWPMEEPSGSTQFASSDNAPPLATIFAGVSAAQSSSLQGSDPLPEINGGSLRASIPTYTGGTSTIQLRAIIKNSSATPAGSPFIRFFFSGASPGIGWIDLIYTSATQLSVQAYTADGTLIAGGVTTTYNLGANIYMMQLTLTNTGSAVNYELVTTNYTTNSTLTSGPQSWAFRSTGAAKAVWINPTGQALGNSVVGHVSIAGQSNPYDSTIYKSMNGYSGESAVARLIRLSSEGGITFGWISGGWTGMLSESMGYQKTGEILDLMQECADTDGGILRESTTDGTDLYYVPLGTLQSPKGDFYTEFAYVENLFNPFTPVGDDQDLKNQVTVTRGVGGGGSATSVVRDGPLGVNAVGLYDDAITLNLDSPFSARPQADWRVNIGTWNEDRFPQIGVDLADYRVVNDTAFRAKVFGVAIGDAIRITDIPAHLPWLSPFDVYQIVVGVTETITPDSHRFVWNCIPAGPYRAGHWGESTDRYSGEGTATSGALTTTATAITVVPPMGVVWTHADGDYDIVIDGERMTVKNVVGNVMTVVRSVNGIVKTHISGSAVSLLDPALWGL